MAATLVQWPKDKLADVWPLIKSFVESGCENSCGRYTVEGMARNLESGVWDLWVIWQDSLERENKIRAVVCTQIYKEISGIKVCSICFTAGEHRQEWIHLLYDLEQWAKKNGCDKIEAWVRKGWVKDLVGPDDYTATRVIIEKDFAA